MCLKGIFNDCLQPGFYEFLASDSVLRSLKSHAVTWILLSLFIQPSNSSAQKRDSAKHYHTRSF